MARPRATDASGNKINKSQAIRDMLIENPKLKTREVVSQLGDRNIKVTPTLVYYIKSRMRKAKRKQKRDDIDASSKQMLGKDALDIVIRVRGFASEVGGIRKLKQLVDLLAE